MLNLEENFLLILVHGQRRFLHNLGDNRRPTNGETIPHWFRIIRHTSTYRGDIHEFDGLLRLHKRHRDAGDLDIKKHLQEKKKSI